MKLLNITHKKGLLDGQMVTADLDLQTFAAVTIIGIRFLTAARLIVCENVQVQQWLIGDALRPPYQMMQPVPVGVLFEIASSGIWHDFTLDRPKPKPDHAKYLRYPQEWQPVKLKSRTGKLPCIIEARCGNDKHKAHISIDLIIL
jgi:hypothetical protein